jgi:hypothetical protein
MILYQLQCADGHAFEAWFKDSSAYDRQEKRGEVHCPVCSSSEVGKAIMAPHVASSSTRESDAGETRARQVAREILMAMGQLRKEVEKNCEYVGERFADEARAIHYGEAPERGIYGEASQEEAKALHEEEIPVRFLGLKSKHKTHN